MNSVHYSIDIRFVKREFQESAKKFSGSDARKSDVMDAAVLQGKGSFPKILSRPCEAQKHSIQHHFGGAHALAHVPCLEASEQQPYAVVDTNAVYNSALTSYMLGNFDTAKKYYEKSLELGYYGDEGDAYAKLADIAMKQADTVACSTYL